MRHSRRDQACQRLGYLNTYIRKAAGFVIFWIVVVFTTAVLGQANTDIPSAADPGRTLDDRLKSIQKKPSKRATSVIVPQNPIGQEAPKGAEKILFRLESLSIDGMSRFEPNHFSYLYESSLGKKVSVATLWNIAQSITSAYRDEGHFLSKAYIPPQKIDKGHARISVIEGHIAEVHIKGSSSQDAILHRITKILTREAPTRLATLERGLLLLDQLYGVNFDAVLGRRKWEPGKVGEVVLTLIQKEDPSEVSLAANNYGSRYAGPYSTSLTYNGSLVPYQQTSVSGFFNVIGGNELVAVNGQHKVQLTPEVEAKLQLSASRSAPGFTLKSQNIRGRSVKWGAGVIWHAIRQRTQSLSVSFETDIQRNKTDLLGEALTREDIMAARASLDYGFQDRWSGFNDVMVTLSHGVPWGSSRKGESNLSRANASPNFTKLEVNYDRQMSLSKDISLNTRFAGQWASNGLYSPEEFGFGGINIGRAYDFSEITGDHGFGFLAELQYRLSQVPSGYIANSFVFYDFGKVWNLGEDTAKRSQASSIGIGIRVFGENGLNMDATLAFPLVKEINTPQSFGNSHGPVLRFGATYRFRPERKPADLLKTGVED